MLRVILLVVRSYGSAAMHLGCASSAERVGGGTEALDGSILEGLSCILSVIYICSECMLNIGVAYDLARCTILW